MSNRIISCVLLLLAATLGRAQLVIPQLNLASPSDALWVHLHYLQKDSYDPGIAAEAFTGSDSISRVEWAVKLKQIYDGSGLYIRMNQVPQSPEYLDSISLKHYYTPFPNELPQIYLEREGDKWYYSIDAAQTINDLHKAIYPLGTDALVSFFGRQSEKTFLGISIWQYTGIFILLLISLLVYFVLTFLFRWIIRKLSGFDSATIPGFSEYVRKIANIASVAIVLWIVKVLLPLIQLPVKTSAYVHIGLRIVITFLLILLVLRIVNLVTAYFVKVSERTESRMDDQFIPILKQIAKVLIVTFGVLHILNLLDFNITALIAGLSIGGLALALAAQDTIKNFLGSVMIFADRPFQIGDFVEGSGFVGTVVEVGFRSTRIKTSDTSIISVPNGNMANVSVTNKGARQFRLFNTTLGLVYSTPPDLVEAFMLGVKKILLRHPHVSKDDIYVRLVELGPSSLNIFVRAYLEASNYAMELEVKESINLALLRWAETLGVQYAFPTSTLHVESLPGQINLTPNYDTSEEKIGKKWQQFMENFESRLLKEDTGKEGSDQASEQT